MGATDPMQGMSPRSAPSEEVVLVADSLHVIYRVYDDRTRSLRHLFARRFRPPRHRKVHAIRGVNLEVQRSEALGVIGRNGSGKSTLLRALAGLVPPDEGSIRARHVPVLLGVGSVLQPELSCRRNVQIGATALGIRRRDAIARTDEILHFAGIEDHADLPFRTLSSGMRARLQFAIATTVTPDILMIDETLAVGDAEFREKSQARMAKMVDGSGTVVLVSHSMPLLKSVCSRVIWLEKGVVVAEGNPAEVVERYNDDVLAKRRADT